jgi:hypothetical protein
VFLCVYKGLKWNLGLEDVVALIPHVRGSKEGTNNSIATCDYKP